MPRTLLRVITYNLHKGRGRRQKSILVEAACALAERAPDILLCQEVYRGVAFAASHRSPGELIVDEACHFLTEVVGHPHIFGPNAFYRRGCHGNATFAQYPVSEHRNVDMTLSFFEKRGMLHTVLDVDGMQLEVLNIHFSLTKRQRRRQWHKLLEALPRDESVPVLAGGDFNDWSGSLDRHVRESGALDNALWPIGRRFRRSFPSHRPRFSLDRVYFRGLRLVGARVLDGDPWCRLSDHLPLEVDFEPGGVSGSGS